MSLVETPERRSGESQTASLGDLILKEEIEQQRANILLVDDQESKLLSHEAILEDLGENIIKANSGLKALEFLLKNECAVILLDINMPEMDGFETAALIRSRPSLERTPIIFVSAYNTSDLDRLKGYDIGAVDYLFVPVVPPILKAKVQVFVEIYKQKLLIRRQANYLAMQNRRQQEQICLIEDLNRKLRLANEELEAFSYTISHDLRSPLRAMQGYSRALIEDCAPKLAEEEKDYLQRIAKASARMDQLIQDILAYSRVSKTELKTKHTELAPLIQDLMQQYDALRAPRARIEIEGEMHPVVAHEACLAQCFANLLGNAAKFVARGTMPEIRIRTERHGSRVKIRIIDNGIGIDPAHHSRIFQMFGRIHEEKAYDGTGIGLSIVKKAVERMGGTVGLESTLGQGSCFWIELPASEP
jgi:two-component system sensor histidine kinase/response regulator